MADTMPLDGSVVGISAYLDATSRAALDGRIKKTAADFVVREITLQGHVLALTDNDADRLPTHSERDAVIQTMAEAKQSSGKQRAKEPLVFEEPPGGWHEELRRLVAHDEVVTAIGRVASGDDGNGEGASCLLDAPTDFRERVFLQVCIQHCFPSLDFKLRKCMAEKDSLSAEADAPLEALHEIEVVQDNLYKKFRMAGVSEENACRLLTFIRKGATDPGASRGIELEHEDSREARTVLHRQISSSSAVLKTRTESRRGEQRIVVFFSPQNSKKRKRGDQPPEPYVRFVLQKTNLEHFSCFEKLARTLKRPAQAFATAGTKDKVAITYQHVTVQGVLPTRLLELNRGGSGDSHSGIRVGHFEYVASPMALGSLTGNRFSITVRDLPSDFDRDDFQQRVDHVASHGFINYFGFQRVGLPASIVRPHQIGELIVAAKWEDAVKKILTPSVHDPPECAAIKSAYLANTEDVDAMLKMIPQHSMPAERSVLMGLKRFGSAAWEAAIRNIPFARRTMYLHAYQSLLFNTLASFRVEHYGDKVVVGDLVREDGKAEVIVADDEMAAKLNARKDGGLARVVLPLPGSNVLLPTNAVGDHLKQLLDAHGTAAALSTSTELKGTYRALLEKPRDVSWQRVANDSSAVQLEFSLSSGCFATMCLREILRTDL